MNFIINEEEYLQDLFAIEAEQESITDQLYYNSFDLANNSYESLMCSIESRFGTEAIGDVISYHKNKLLILFKNCLSELIRYVLEFFGVLTSQKKVLLIMSKRIKEFLKSIEKAWSKRMSRDGKSNLFEENPVNIKSLKQNVLGPIMLLQYIADGILLHKKYDNKGGILNISKFTISGSLPEASMNKIKEVMVKSAEVFAVSDIINEVLTNKERLAKIADIASLDDKEGAIINEYQKLYGNEDSFDDYYTSNEIEGDLIQKLFNIDAIDRLREKQDGYQEAFNDIKDEIKSDIEEVEIDSQEKLYSECITVLKAAIILIDSRHKQMDFQKELNDIRKKLTEAQNTFNKMDNETLELASDRFQLLNFLTMTSNTFNRAKKTVNDYLHLCSRMVDNGLTDVKKLEAHIV